MDFEEMFKLTDEEKQKIEDWVNKTIAPGNGESFGGYVVAFEFSAFGTVINAGFNSYDDRSKLVIRGLFD